MKSILISLFVVIDLIIVGWIVKLRLDDVNSFTDGIDYLILPLLGMPYSWLYFTEESEERRKNIRRILTVEFVLFGLILIEWWVVKKMA